MKTVSLLAATIFVGLMSFMVVSSGRQPAFAQSPAVTSAGGRVRPDL